MVLICCVININFRVMGHGDTNLKAVEDFRLNLKQCLDYYDNLLGHPDYLVGDLMDSISRQALISNRISPW